MNKVTQTCLYRQSLIEYAKKHGVTKAAIRYRTNRQYIYRWMKRYDGTASSLTDRSRRPHHHPNQHRPEEIKLISDMRRRNPHAGLVVFWVKLRQRGYTRSIAGLFRVMSRLGQLPIKPPNPKYIPKPYEQMTYPGQRIQIDVKHVPAACLVGEAKGNKFYQYTAIDEYSRLRYLEGFQEISTYSSMIFLKNALAFFKKHKFSVHCVQTDNGPEFTRRFSNGKPTIFEQLLLVEGITYKQIKPFTPRHNGKVERSHRKDNEYFYAEKTFYSFIDFKKQLAFHNSRYNNFPIRPLAWTSPLDFLRVTYV
ncbi:MAG: DDE-type integrase/transposase/recombinase [Oscillospiraceae bacterium]|nr:DDE-type integrase/transposase/recombinase [Oscillospiraceae bacterium]